MISKINLSTENGKLVHLNNYDVIVEIRPRGRTYDIEKVYKTNGQELTKGDCVGARQVDESFYDELYQDVDEMQYFEVR